MKLEQVLNKYKPIDFYNISTGRALPDLATAEREENVLLNVFDGIHAIKGEEKYDNGISKERIAVFVDNSNIYVAGIFKDHLSLAALLSNIPLDNKHYQCLFIHSKWPISVYHPTKGSEAFIMKETEAEAVKEVIKKKSKGDVKAAIQSLIKKYSAMAEMPAKHDIIKEIIEETGCADSSALTYYYQVAKEVSIATKGALQGKKVSKLSICRDLAKKLVDSGVDIQQKQIFVEQFINVAQCTAQGANTYYLNIRKELKKEGVI